MAKMTTLLHENDGRAVNLERAASVIVHDPRISAFLQRTDPKARKQLMDALMDTPVLDVSAVKPEDAFIVLKQELCFLTSVITGLRHLAEKSHAGELPADYLPKLTQVQALVDDLAGTPEDVIADREVL